MKRTSLDWHEQMPLAYRHADAVATWLRPIPWQWFVTATFPWNVRAETAVKKLRAFINDLEKHHRSTVCMVAGQESKPRLHGMSVPVHFHLLLASHSRLSAEAIESLWLAQVTSRRNQGRNDESVRLEPYNEHQRGPEYCLKSLNDMHGDWHLHRLRDFHPDIGGSDKPSHRSVRGSRRHTQRRSRLSSGI
jgi:hypothetical protein